MSTFQYALRLAILGTYGAGNLGDEATLLAFKQNFEHAFPNGILWSICSDPDYIFPSAQR